MKENILKISIQNILNSKMKFSRKLTEIKRQLINTRDRALYGYCGEDWFEFFYNFCDRNQKLFREFRDNSHSKLLKFPQSPLPDEAGLYMTEEEQRDFFNNLIEILEEIKNEDYLSQKLFNKKFYNLDIAERKKLWSFQDSKVKEFFTIMREHFLQLWD